MHEVLVNCLEGLSLPRKSVVRLTDRPNMTLDVYRGRKTTMQQPPLASDISQYMLRNSRNINIPFTRTKISRKSCIPSSISLWNSLEEDIHSSSSLSGFRENIKKITS